MNSKRPPICDYEGSDYQSVFWDQGGRQYENQVEAVALQRLLPKTGKLLLEIGAGAGRNTPRYHNFERVVLLDYSRTQLQLAQKRLGDQGNYLYVAADAYRLPFVPGLFDAATMIRTLHHLVDPQLALQQVHKVLQSRAIFILEFANKQNYKAILRYLFRQQTWSPFTTDSVEFVELNFDFHPRSIRAWLKETGFSIERQLSVSHFRVNVLKRLIPLQILVSLDSIAQLTGDLWQFTPSVFVRAKALGVSPSPETGTFFCCPECGYAPLPEGDNVLICPNCTSPWSFQDGIYDFREPVKSL